MGPQGQSQRTTTPTGPQQSFRGGGVAAVVAAAAARATTCREFQSVDRHFGSSQFHQGGQMMRFRRDRTIDDMERLAAFANPGCDVPRQDSRQDMPEEELAPKRRRLVQKTRPEQVLAPPTAGRASQDARADRPAASIGRVTGTPKLLSAKGAQQNIIMTPEKTNQRFSILTMRPFLKLPYI